MLSLALTGSCPLYKTGFPLQLSRWSVSQRAWLQRRHRQRSPCTACRNGVNGLPQRRVQFRQCRRVRRHLTLVHLQVLSRQTLRHAAGARGSKSSWRGLSSSRRRTHIGILENTTGDVTDRAQGKTDRCSILCTTRVMGRVTNGVRHVYRVPVHLFGVRACL